MAPGAPGPGPIFTYTPWLSMGSAFLATTGINAALYARRATGRGQHVETSLLQAALALTASKWMRVEHNDAPGLPLVDLRPPGADKGFFQVLRRSLDPSNGCPTPIRALSSADGDTLAVDPDVDGVVNDPDRIPPDPENIVVLAHYFPNPWLRRSRRFPSDAVGRGGGTRPASRCSRSAPPRRPCRIRHSLAEAAVVDVEHPEHGTLRQAGILYQLSRTPGPGAASGPAGSANTPTRCSGRGGGVPTSGPGRPSLHTPTGLRWQASPCSTSASPWPALRHPGPRPTWART